MKVVFITFHYLNGNGGGVFASRAYINAWAEIADEIILLYPMKEGADPEGIHPKVRKIAVWDRRSKLQKGLAFLLGQPHRFRKIDRYIGDIRFDLAVLDTSMVARGVVDCFKRKGTKVVTIHHNYQYEYFRDNTSGLTLFPALFWAKRFEAETVRKSDLNLTLTEVDRCLLKQHYGTGQEKIEVLGTFEYRPADHPVYPDISEPRFLISGDLGNKQTEDSLLPWLDNYFPVLKEVFPDATLTLAGKNPSPALLSKAAEKNVEVVPCPQEMAPLLAAAKYYICPISLGGGMKLRVMDGLSAGLPVLCHAVSARGYESFVKKGVLLPYQDKVSFREQLAHLSDRRITKSEAIELYKEIFSFESGKRRLEQILQKNHLLLEEGFRHGKKRLLVFHPTISPYRVDFFNSLSAAFDSRICLYYPDEKTFDYSAIYSQLFFRPVLLNRVAKIGDSFFCKEYWRVLDEFNPDIVMVGEYGIGTLQVVLHRWIRRKKYKLVSICDDNYDILSGGSDFGVLHRLARGILAPCMNEIILVEPLAQKWYQDHYHKGYFFPIIRDDEKQRAAFSRQIGASKELIIRHQLAEKHVFLFVGRLVDLKNVKTLINSFSTLNKDENALIIIGSGPEEQALKSLAKQYKDHRIIFTGRLEGDSLYAWYNVADYFVLPSVLERFGAVINEALLAGCYCLVSNKAGSRCLIENGINGYTFNPDNEEELSTLIRKISFRFPPIKPLRQIKPNLMRVRYSEAIQLLIKHLEEI